MIRFQEFIDTCTWAEKIVVKDENSKLLMENNVTFERIPYGASVKSFGVYGNTLVVIVKLRRKIEQ